jgi:MFS superfamily sulfate permease-like transporter
MNAYRKKNLERTFPILKWGRTYTKQKCISDLIAGITVGLTVLPQGLAYATVAGLPPIVSVRYRLRLSIKLHGD